MFEGYVCEIHRERLKDERVVRIYNLEQARPPSDAPEECIYCGEHTNYLFVVLEDF